MVLYEKDIVETEFPSLPPTTSVFEAAKATGQGYLGLAIVASREGTQMGIVTEWDVLAKVVAQGRDPSEVRLADVMGPSSCPLGRTKSIDRVAQLMADMGTRRVLVVNSKVLGVIRLKTILARPRDYVDTISTQIARAQLPLF